MSLRLPRFAHPPEPVRPQRPALRLVSSERRVCPAAPEARVREAGGPEDVASYRCGCGYQFRASVTASVACPHCGGEQAW